MENENSFYRVKSTTVWPIAVRAGEVGLFVEYSASNKRALLRFSDGAEFWYLPEELVFLGERMQEDEETMASLLRMQTKLISNCKAVVLH